MRFFAITVLFIISYILNSTIFSYLTVAGMKPDIILIFVVFYALHKGPKEGAIVGFIGGFIQDLLLGNFIGLNTFSKLVVGFVLGLLEKKIYKENFFVPILTVGLAVFINENMIYLLGLLSIKNFPADYVTVIRVIILPGIIYNTCLTPFLYPKFYRSVKKGFLRQPDY